MEEITATISTADCIRAQFTKPVVEKLVRKYLDDASTASTDFREAFVDTVWEVPGWANPVEEVASMHARSIAILGVCGEDGIPLSSLINEERALITCYKQALQFKFPFYCVGKRMLEAAMNTKPYDTWDFGAFPLPFPCITFLLPKGTKFSGQLIKTLTVYEWRAKDGTNKVVFLGCNKSFVPFIGVHPLPDDNVMFVDPKTVNPIAGEAAGDAAELIRATLNLVGIMHARAKLIHDGAVLRTVGKAGKVRTVRQARTLGQGYVRKVAALTKGEKDSTGRTVTPHYRSGHWHTVSYGPRHELKRKDWFEPVWVCGK